MDSAMLGPVRLRTPANSLAEASQGSAKLRRLAALVPNVFSDPASRRAETNIEIADETTRIFLAIDCSDFVVRADAPETLTDEDDAPTSIYRAPRQFAAIDDEPTQIWTRPTPAAVETPVPSADVLLQAVDVRSALADALRLLA